MLRSLLFACLTITVAACGSSPIYVSETDSDWKLQEPPPPAQERYRIYLVGDVGGVTTDQPDPVLSTLRNDLETYGENGAVVFLGDNIYCCGLPDSTDPLRPQAEAKILTILQSVEHFPGRIIFIPGNHDWNKSRAGGLEAIRRQEQFVEAYLNRGNTFVPDNGFPGPAEIDLTDDITLLAIDTEWWLTEHPKSFGDDGKNEVHEPADFLLELREEIIHEDDKKLLVVGHHPLYSNGIHAGRFPLKKHLFPLTHFWKSAYIPLPLIGSIPLLYARYYGFSEQDLGHPRYRQLRDALERIFGVHEFLIYASGHDHTLQYFRAGSFLHPQHYVVSGAGSKPSPVRSGHGAVFGAGELGYSTIHYYDDDSVWLSFWGVSEPDLPPALLFRTRLKSQKTGASSAEREPESGPGLSEFPDYTDSVKVIPVNPAYRAGSFKEYFFGSQYRRLWATPVPAPYLDMGRMAGGLTPVKRGGGMQTTSIRLRDRDGKEYDLRSIDKDPTRGVPPHLRDTFAEDIVQDQVASMHPYGALVIPTLAKAAGVYHAKPQLVYVPDDPRLGPYRDLVAGRVMMLEDRPDDDMSHLDRYGRSEDVESAAKMYENIDEDNDNYVDQRAFVRARLFDMLIGDWDRHRGQWRWASFKNEDKGRHFKPIPRDRDWAFNKRNGLFPSLAPYFDRKLQEFDHDYSSIKGLTTNGAEQDRRLTNALTRADWIEASEHIRTSLTDNVIEKAMRQLPDTIYALVGAEMTEKLIARRDRLRRAAEDYYELLSKAVDVVGSHKHERFEVRALDNETTEVLVYKTGKERDTRKRIYSRQFHAGETNEIRLYGLGGNDTFVIESASPSTTLRAIGGPGEDLFINDSRAVASRIRMYDTEDGNAFDVATGKVVRTDDPFITTYNAGEYKHDRTWPQAFFGSNADDGVFIGGGAKFVSHGFKKQPFAREHTVLANFAARTKAFNVVYRGHFVRAIDRFDLLLNAEVLSPNNIRNFYGLGNRTENEADDREFYQAQLTQIRISPSVRVTHPFGASLELGTFLRVTDVEQDEDRFVVEPQPGISPNTFEDQWFTGASVSAAIESVDVPGNPGQGFRLKSSLEANLGFRNATDSYGKIRSDLTIYASPLRSPRITVAGRIGVDHTLGAFPFYDASTLGGADNLRGYRSTRFAGRTAFFQNLEVRARLFRFSAYVANGTAGLLGFLDNGRVWTEVDAPNRTWHQGYGGGLWAHVLDTFTITSWLGASSDDFTYTLQLGFQY